MRATEKTQAAPACKLQDVLFSMENIRDWMSEARRREGIRPSFFDTRECICNTQSAPRRLAQEILFALELKPGWHGTISRNAAFRLLRTRLSSTGVMVFVDDCVNGEENRPLGDDDFHALVLSDATAPLIFVNVGLSPRDRLLALSRGAVALRNRNTEPHVVLYGDGDAELYAGAAIYLVEEMGRRNTVGSARSGRDPILGSAIDRLDFNFAQMLYACVREGSVSYTEAYRLAHLWGDDFERLAALCARS